MEASCCSSHSVMVVQGLLEFGIELLKLLETASHKVEPIAREHLEDCIDRGHHGMLASITEKYLDRFRVGFALREK